MHTDCPVCTKNAKDKAAKAAKEEAGRQRRLVFQEAKLARGESLNPRTAELALVALWALQERLADFLDFAEAYNEEHICHDRDMNCEACSIECFAADAKCLDHLLDGFEGSMTSMMLSFPEWSERIYNDHSLREDIAREKARMAAEAQASREPGQVLPFVPDEPEPVPVVRFREFL